MKFLILEDEESPFELISSYIEELSVDSEVQRFKKVSEAIEYLETQKADIIFLDLDLDGEWGMDIFEVEAVHNIPIVVTTSYDNYGIQALKLSAVDYLVKPYDFEEFSTAFEKAARLKNLKTLKLSYDVLSNNLLNLTKPKILIHGVNDVHIVFYNDILYIESDGSYSKITLKSGESIVSSKNLKHFNSILTAPTFFRCHRSFLVNSESIKSYNKKTLKLKLFNGQEVPISVRRKDEIYEILK
ncbi:MAG: LytTR family DNA-binding domain-containing protein [Flavobacteriales bacterium]|nr:LytTR family DNA-binding domain-containing protein [Flavobacteriales bacterium]